MTAQILALQAIHSAVARIGKLAVPTPLLQSNELNAMVGGQVFIKAENLQRSGSFKFRGACNRILALTPAQCARGVVAYSSGNHALAVAEAARIVGIDATVIMPADAPRIKIDGCRQRGATVRLYDRERDVREDIGNRLVETHGMTLIPPYDDDFVMAGAGTGALEAIAQMEGTPIDTAIVCCSGGGLAAGWSLAVRAAYPQARMVVAEPEGFDDTGRSLLAGQRLANTLKAGSICDALLANTPGERTFPILQASSATGVSVSDTQTLAAMYFAYAALKLVLEPGGAIALAAVLSQKLELRDRNTLVICSGGNVDSQMFAECLRAGANASETVTP